MENISIQEVARKIRISGNIYFYNDCKYGNNYLSFCWDEAFSGEIKLTWDISRDNALKFAKLISEELLEKVANWIEKKKKETEQAIKVIEEVN